jgi:predicted P-loop ATPase
MAKKPKQEAQRADSIEQESETKQLKKNSKTELIESYLNFKYDFRFNEITGQPEMINLLFKESEFYSMDDYKLNSLKRELEINGITASTSAIAEIIKSDFSPRVNPVEEYFKDLPPHDGTDYIAQLCDTIKVINHDNWREYFKKWIVAVVANVFTPNKCANHTCLVLTGGQGKGKTTWLNNLTPKKLDQYSFTGKIDTEAKDTETLIAENLFINIDDQLKALNKKDENSLKTLITKDFIKYRRPYDRYMKRYSHLASFMASINGNDFLTDPTGSRRFLPFEVEAIDINKKVDIDKVFAQAYAEYKNGFRYYFTEDEILELHHNNGAFAVISLEQQIITDIFELPATKNDATHYWNNATITAEIEKHTKQRISTKKVGEALANLGYQKFQKTIVKSQPTQWVYSLILKSDMQIRLEKENTNKQLQSFE